VVLVGHALGGYELSSDVQWLLGTTLGACGRILSTGRCGSVGGVYSSGWVLVDVNNVCLCGGLEGSRVATARRGLEEGGLVFKCGRMSSPSV
jgi:hypothetical protein